MRAASEQEEILRGANEIPSVVLLLVVQLIVVLVTLIVIAREPDRAVLKPVPATVTRVPPAGVP